MSGVLMSLSDEDVSLRDNKMLELFASGFTPQEVEESMGVPAEQAVVRVKKILASTDVFTSIEKKKLLIQSIYKLKRDVETSYDNSNPREVDAYVKVLRLLGDALDKTEKLTSEELEAAARAQAVQLVRLFEASWVRARELLEAEYPHVDSREVEDAFKSGLYEEIEG